MTANPTQTAVTLTLGESAFALVFDFEAIAEAEDITNRALLTGLVTKDISAPRINTVRAMFFACARTHHPELTFADAKRAVTRENIAHVWGRVLEAWTAGLAEPDSTAQHDDPTTGRP